MYYEVAASRGMVDEWRVEAVNDEGDGEIYVAIFTGPSAKERAEEYAAWKSTRDRRSSHSPVPQERRQPAHA